MINMRFIYDLYITLYDLHTFSLTFLILSTSAHRPRSRRWWKRPVPWAICPDMRMPDDAWPVFAWMRSLRPGGQFSSHFWGILMNHPAMNIMNIMNGYYEYEYYEWKPVRIFGCFLYWYWFTSPFNWN